MTTDVLDSHDPMSAFAAEFAKPPGKIYLDGNSLGLLCQSAQASLERALDLWRTQAIEGWTGGDEPWFDMSRHVATRLASILGADADDVMVGNSTTVNLHQLLATFHQPPQRILVDKWSFPSDRYAVESHLLLRGQDPTTDLEIVPDCGDLIDEAMVRASMAERVGMAVLPAVNYRTGQLLDLAVLTESACQRNVRIAWDCSHSAGIVPHRFRDDGIELAFGCTYKWLNGGPGSPGWLYVHPKLRARAPGLAGWFGSDPARQFQMSSHLQPAHDAGRYMIGTPHILSLAPLLGSLDLINRCGVAAMRTRSLALTQYFLKRQEFQTGNFAILTPADDHRRGGHVAFRHRQARHLAQALRQRGIVVDFRPPDILRLAPAPFFTSLSDCQKAAAELVHLDGTANEWEAAHAPIQRVT